jgi:tRNA dimethylallyltransferase
MIVDGLLTEVEGLRQNPRLSADLPSMRSVGYRQAWQFLDGELDRNQFQSQGVAASRQLAKRQLTWLRKELDAVWVDPTVAGFQHQIEARIQHFIGEML